MIDLPALHIFLAHSGLIALWSRDIWKTSNRFISLFFIWCYYCCSTNIVYKKYIILWILDKKILTEFTDQCPCALQNKLIFKPRCAFYEAMILMDIPHTSDAVTKWATFYFIFWHFEFFILYLSSPLRIYSISENTINYTIFTINIMPFNITVLIRHGVF